MLRQRILIFEYIIGLYFLLQTILPSQFSRSSSLVGFILLSFTKYHFEGFRITYLIFFLIQLILLFVNSIYLAIPITVLVYLAITYFPIYKYPAPTGKYRVGYKMITVQGHKESTTVGVYYPANEKTKDVKYSPSHKAWERFADIMRLYADYEKKFLIPKIVFKLLLSFLEYQYLGVNKDASIVKIEGNSGGGYPVIMFSHGLSANIHIYSILLKEWASHGFVVFSVDHEDEIHVDITGFKVFADYLRIRNGQLSLRKDLVKSVLDKVCDPKFVQDLFEDSSVTLNYNQLFATGHSFGGVTAAEVSAEDKRITGGMVLLDPWYECANLDVIYKETNLPLLSVRSSDYDKPGDLRTRIITHVEKSNAIKGRTVSGMVEKAGHNASTDLLILMPREMAALGDLRLDMIEEHIRTHYMLTRVFLNSVVEHSKGKETGDLKSFVMENYKIEQAKTGKKDIFVVD